MNIIISPGPSFLWNPFFGQFNEKIGALGNRLTAPRLRHLFFADVFHVHFPEHKVSVNKNFFIAFTHATAMLVFMLIIKIRRKPIVWMVHDVLPLRRYHPHLCTMYMVCVRRMVTGYIFLSQTSRNEFERLFPEERAKPVLKILHPPYSVSLVSPEEKLATRKKLGVGPDEFLIGYLGDIKPYKNPDILSDVPERLTDGRATVLSVAGKPDSQAVAFEKELIDRRHIRISERVSDRELESYIQASDIVFLPYAWGWNSGLLFLVLSCNQKCLASNLPIFKEMQEHFGSRWITTFDLAASDQQSEITRAINAASKISCGETEIKNLAEKLEGFSFPHMATQVETFYISLRRQKKSSRIAT